MDHIEILSATSVEKYGIDCNSSCLLFKVWHILLICLYKTFKGFIIFTYMCGRWCAYVHMPMLMHTCQGTHGAVRGQLLGVSPLLPPRRSLISNLGLQASQKAPLATEASPQPQIYCFVRLYFQLLKKSVGMGIKVSGQLLASHA